MNALEYSLAGFSKYIYVVSHVLLFNSYLYQLLFGSIYYIVVFMLELPSEKLQITFFFNLLLTRYCRVSMTELIEYASVIAGLLEKII